MTAGSLQFVPVRRKAPDERRRFQAVKLYLDDLEELDRIMRAACPKVHLEAGAYDLDAVEEVGQLPPEASRKLKWSGFGHDGRSFLYIHVARDSLFASGERCDAACLSALHEIEQVMRRRRRPLAHFSLRFYGILPSVVLLLATALHALAGFRFGFWFWLAAAPLLVWSVYTYLTIGRRALVVLEHSNVWRSYWQRNRDALSVNLISAVVGAVVGAGLGVLGTLLLVK